MNVLCICSVLALIAQTNISSEDAKSNTSLINDFGKLSLNVEVGEGVETLSQSLKKRKKISMAEETFSSFCRWRSCMGRYSLYIHGNDSVR
jgi:hypothetical protein